MEDRMIEKVEEPIKQILDQGIDLNNIEYLYKLSKIKHMAKEDKEMNMEYGYYPSYNGRRPGYDTYGRGNYENYGNYGEGSYGRRGQDSRYRGDDELDRMSMEYGRYQENRRRYGAGQETDKSFHYMIKSLEDFIQVLYEEADNEMQKQQLRETLQRSMM